MYFLLYHHNTDVVALALVWLEQWSLFSADSWFRNDKETSVPMLFYTVPLTPKKHTLTEKKKYRQQERV